MKNEKEQNSQSVVGIWKAQIPASTLCDSEVRLKVGCPLYRQTPSHAPRGSLNTNGLKTDITSNLQSPSIPGCTTPGPPPPRVDTAQGCPGT